MNARSARSGEPQTRSNRCPGFLGAKPNTHTHTHIVVLTVIAPRTAPSSILSGRNTASTNVSMILSPSDCQHGACKVLECVLQPILLWAPGGQSPPASTCWEPFCLQEEEQKCHRLCQKNEKLSKGDVLLPGSKTSLQFLDLQTPRSATACPAGPPATL